MRAKELSASDQVGRPWLFGINANGVYLYGRMIYKDDPVQIEKMLDNIKKSGN